MDTIANSSWLSGTSLGYELAQPWSFLYGLHSKHLIRAMPLTRRTSTTLSMLEIDVQGADFATAVARALQSTQAQRRLESLLVDSLQAQDLVINQLIVDEPDLG